MQGEEQDQRREMWRKILSTCVLLYMPQSSQRKVVGGRWLGYLCLAHVGLQFDLDLDRRRAGVVLYLSFRLVADPVNKILGLIGGQPKFLPFVIG